MEEGERIKSIEHFYGKLSERGSDGGEIEDLWIREKEDVKSEIE